MISGEVADGDVHVIPNPSAAALVLAQADQTGSLIFNGNDAVVLRRGSGGSPVVDSIGQVGFDPGTEWGTAPITT